jgi:hypothetical protein
MGNDRGHEIQFGSASRAWQAGEIAVVKQAKADYFS